MITLLTDKANISEFLSQYRVQSFFKKSDISKTPKLSH